MALASGFVLVLLETHMRIRDTMGLTLLENFVKKRKDNKSFNSM